MNAPARLSRPGYAGKVAIRRALEAARDAGLDPAGYDIMTDGTIRVYGATAMPKKPMSLFDELEQSGKI